MDRDHPHQGPKNQRVGGFEAVSKVMTTFYKKLLGEMDHHRTYVDNQVIDMGSCLNIEKKVQLCFPFSNSDIKNVLFSISTHKSLGPDGYNSGFYKACWKDIGPSICSAIKEFFFREYLPSFYGQTKLVLLPKVPNPERANDFRPISYCNVVYKCITKLICARLKEVLPHLIDAVQGPFINGRELLFNVLLCQDLARGYQRKHTPPQLHLKVDLHKEFDSVR